MYVNQSRPTIEEDYHAIFTLFTNGSVVRLETVMDLHLWRWGTISSYIWRGSSLTARGITMDG
jgi:hypothetical protein